MAPTPNPRLLYAKIPSEELPVAGEHLVFDPKPTIDLDVELKSGQFLTKTLLLSPEPFMRERLRDPSIISYSTPMVLGQPLVGFGLVVVVRSEKEGVKAGDHMFGFTPWEHYTVQPYVDARVDYKGYPAYTFDMDLLVLQPVPDPQGAFPWTAYVTALGCPALTAFIGVEKLSGAKKGETIYVSAGASGVGSIVIQLCKIKGLKVIASAGSDSKVEFLRSIGADVAFNYKTTPVAKALKEHGPLDLYFDNVCGEQLEAAIDNMNMNGRVLCCGAISEYNIPREECYGVKNLSLVFKRRISFQGFIVADSPEMNARFFAEIPPLVAQGKIKTEAHEFKGLENGAAAFLSMFDGSATARPVLVVDPQYGS
ncbi:hypothetical protein B0H14DRAFT_2787905 [Mycena olivaceomarginata]|nr:hypothetical protein B0H14DRAFT_2787905 [Mycena olivaceomarginata]